MAAVATACAQTLVDVKYFVLGPLMDPAAADVVADSGIFGEKSFFGDDDRGGRRCVLDSQSSSLSLSLSLPPWSRTVSERSMPLAPLLLACAHE